jgi:hypothetical protein
VTNADLLTKIDAAIDGILLGNQSHAVLGRVYTKANLADLWSMRKDVMTSIAAETAGGGITVKLAVVP